MVPTLHDYTDCVQLMTSNARLCRLVDDVRKRLTEADPVRHHLEMATTSLFEAVTQQLERERREHLYRHVVAWEPRLADSAEWRQAEHQHLVEQMESVRAAFDRRRGESGEQVDRYLQAVTEDFLDAWHEFEHAGEELIRELEHAQA